MRWLLLPISLIYGLAISIRNKLFDWGWKKSNEFNLPVIGVGNITVGGTGKTPHIEYLIKILISEYSLACISRGYKRITRGFKEVSTLSKAIDVGDEPLQIKQKFPKANVIVDEKRVHAIETMLTGKNEPQVVLLDDAYQHRYVDPGLNILLIDYNKPITKDFLLPVGRLREPARNRNRADIVIITKCPEELNPLDFRIMSKELNLFPYQGLYFTTFEYKALKPVFSDEHRLLQIDDLKGVVVILVTGIANPNPIYKKLEKANAVLKKMPFPDHHDFSHGDINKITSTFMAINEKNKIIICTEKDAVRFKSGSYTDELSKLPVYSLPVEVKFLNNEEEKFILALKTFTKNNNSNFC